MKFPKIEAVPQKSLQYYKEKNIFDGEESSEISIFFSADISGLGKQLVAIARKGRWPIFLIPFVQTENGIEQMNTKYSGGAVLETTRPKETSQKLVSRIRKKNIFEKGFNNFDYITTGLYPVMVIKVIESRVELK